MARELLISASPVRRPIQLIVCALIAVVAIDTAAPIDAAARARKQAPRAKTAHAKSQSRRPCTHCQLSQLRTTRHDAAADTAAAENPEGAGAERPDGDGKEAAGAGAVAERGRSRGRKRRKTSLVLRAKIAALHLAEALHVYHPQPHHGQGRPRLTEERVWFEALGSMLGVDVGLTLSEITRVKGKRGDLELIHVVSQDGAGQNFESVVKRIPLFAGQRLEIQGPAINTTGGLPLGFRLLGLGLTSDLFEPGQNRAVSYTAEVKLTERSVLYWAPFWAPAAASALDGALGVAGHHAIANLVGGALPFISAALAVQSTVRAIRTFRNPRAGKLEKALAAGHALADGVRVAFPLAGTLANVALIGVTAGVSYFKVKRARAQAEHPVHPRYLRQCARGGCTH